MNNFQTLCPTTVSSTIQFHSAPPRYDFAGFMKGAMDDFDSTSRIESLQTTLKEISNTYKKLTAELISKSNKLNYNRKDKKTGDS